MQELIAQGWPPDAARTEAGRQFGDVTAIRQTCQSLAQERERNITNAARFAALYQDMKYGVIQWRRNIGPTALAVLALGIGMGMVTAVFSIVYAVVLHPLPFPSPHRLMSVWSTRNGIDDVVTPRNFDAWRRDAHSFSELGALEPTTFTLADAGKQPRYRVVSRPPGSSVGLVFRPS